MEKKMSIDTIIKYIAKFSVGKNEGKIPCCSDDNRYLVVRPVIDRFILMKSHCYLPHRGTGKQKSVIYADSKSKVKEHVRLVNAGSHGYLEHTYCFPVEAGRIYFLPIYDTVEYTFFPGVIMTYGTMDLGGNDKLPSSKELFNYEYPGF